MHIRQPLSNGPVDGVAAEEHRALPLTNHVHLREAVGIRCAPVWVRLPSEDGVIEPDAVEQQQQRSEAPESANAMNPNDGEPWPRAVFCTMMPGWSSSAPGSVRAARSRSLSVERRDFLRQAARARRVRSPVPATTTIHKIRTRDVASFVITYS